MTLCVCACVCVCVCVGYHSGTGGCPAQHQRRNVPSPAWIPGPAERQDGAGHWDRCLQVGYITNVLAFPLCNTCPQSLLILNMYYVEFSIFLFSTSYFSKFKWIHTKCSLLWLTETLQVHKAGQSNETLFRFVRFSADIIFSVPLTHTYTVSYKILSIIQKVSLPLQHLF